MQTSQNRRRKYFIDSRLQGKLVGLAVALILIIAAAGIVPMLLTSPETEISLTPEEQITRDFSNVILVLLIIVIIAVFMTIMYGIRISHRIVGPIYAFNRHMNWIRDGLYVRELKLRKKDEFKNLAQIFNSMQAALRRRSQQSISTCSKAESNLEELLKVLGQEGFDAQSAKDMIERLQQDVAGLRQENEKYLSPAE